jgi:hypothetical protein
MGAALSTRRTIACWESFDLCVTLKHRLVIVSDFLTKQLYMYALDDGRFVRTLGRREYRERQMCGVCGLCISPDGDSVLVARAHHDCVQELRIVDGSLVRLIGLGNLDMPEYVDCNADVIAVLARHSRVTVFAWADGSPRARFGSQDSGPSKMILPQSIKLLADGSGVVIVDTSSNQVRVFTLSGVPVATVGSRKNGLIYPYDALEYAADGSFIVANQGAGNVVKLSRDGTCVVLSGRKGRRGRRGRNDHAPVSLAALPNGCLVLHLYNDSVQHVVDHTTRLAWMRACAGGCSKVTASSRRSLKRK